MVGCSILPLRRIYAAFFGAQLFVFLYFPAAVPSCERLISHNVRQRYEVASGWQRDGALATRHAALSRWPFAAQRAPRIERRGQGWIEIQELPATRSVLWLLVDVNRPLLGSRRRRLLPFSCSALPCIDSPVYGTAPAGTYKSNVYHLTIGL